MQAITDDDKVNSKLAQFNSILKDHVINKNSSLEWVFEKVSNLNGQILTTKHLQLHNAEWIGDTALHLAAIKRQPDAFGILLSRGADYTIKNNNNLTALHKIIKRDQNQILEKYTIDNTFIRMVLSAHLENNNFENPTNNSGLSHFHVACAANNAELAKGFLCSGVAIDHAVKADSSLFPGFTSLHFAARFCALEVVEVLLCHNAHMRIKDAKGMTPLMLALEIRLKMFSEENSDEALRDQNEQIMKLFLEKESKNEMLIEDEWGLSHFHAACTFKESKIAERYLQKVSINHAVNMDSPLWPGYTPLHFAAMCNIDTVKLLLKKEADISFIDAKGVTPFEICIKRYKVEQVYAVLLLNPIWKNILLSDGKTKLTDLVFAMRNPNQFSLFLRRLSKEFNICDSSLWSGSTPMHLAIIFSQKPSTTEKKTTLEDTNLQILNKLFERNSGMVHRQDIHQQTPLHLAFRLDKKPALDLLFTFLESHADLADYVDEDDLSYLHIASFCNNVSLLKRILSIGGNVDATYKGKSFLSPEVHPGSTALHFAVANGSVQVVQILMGRGANVYAKDSNDMTPIHLLLFNPKASNLLMSPNLRDSVVGDTGLSHLHIASWCDTQEDVERLLDNGSNVNGLVNGNSGMSEFKKYEGYSPLLMAYEKRNRCTVKALLLRGADIFVKDTTGKALLYSVFEMNHSYHGLLDDFVQAVKESEDMKIRLRVDTGMTALHIACLDLDAETIEKLLDDGANVNERIRSDSPVFRGYTPLHVVMRVCMEYNVEEIVPLLVKRKADVTLSNDASETAIHMAYDMFDDNEDEICPYLNSMLEAQQDFSVNPANHAGITHFHIACRIFNASVVEKFLKNADFDVNRPIDFFHDEFPGYTPLHLAASNASMLNAILEQLNTVDLLLKYGANVHVENANGDTPLHTCFRCYDTSECLDLFERIASAGADVNARNGDGNTPLYYFLKSDEVVVEGIKTLLRLGCHLNTFNTITECGYMGDFVRELSYEELQKLFSIVIVNFARTVVIDDVGRTVIHNLASHHQVGMSSELLCATFIEQLFKTGCDVDDQDKFGRTALHMSARFYNHECIFGLLLTGVDVNICDLNGKTAFAYVVDTCTICETYKSNDRKCRHLKTLETLSVHVKKLQLCGLDVNKQNEDLAFETLEKLKNEASLKEEFFTELETVKVTKIEGQSLTLFGFLSETGTVANYPRMSVVTRSAVNKFFSSNEVPTLRTKFPELSGILQLQYRKAVARPSLVELARNAFAILIGVVLPEICSNCILIYLTNLELKSLIGSMI